DEARVQARDPAEQRPRAAPHLGAPPRHDDGRERAVVVEREQHVLRDQPRQREAPRTGEQAPHDRRIAALARWRVRRTEILSRLRRRAASTSMRPAHLYTLNSAT